MWTDFSIESTAYPKLPAYGLGVKDTIFSSKNGMQCSRASHGSRDLLEAVILSGTVRKWKCIFFCISYIHFSNLTSFLNPSFFRFITALNPLIMWKWDILIYDLYMSCCFVFQRIEFHICAQCCYRMLFYNFHAFSSISMCLNQYFEKSGVH